MLLNHEELICFKTHSAGYLFIHSQRGAMNDLSGLWSCTKDQVNYTQVVYKLIAKHLIVGYRFIVFITSDYIFRIYFIFFSSPTV